MSNSTKRKAIVAGAVLIGLAGTGTAVAYFTTTGTGTGTGTTSAGVDGALTFVQDALTTMAPGVAAQPLKVTITNPSAENAYIATVSAYITTDKAGCDGTDYTIAGSTSAVDATSAVPLTFTAKDLAASGGTAVATSLIGFNNKPLVDQQPCKGAIATINYIAK